MILKLYTLLFTMLLLFQGCGGKKQITVYEDAPPPPAPKQQELIVEEISSQEPLKPSLSVVAPKGSSIKILNIKPKYYDGIELESGNYLLEVKKSGYESFKKWIKVDKALIYTVKLEKKFELPNFFWRFDHQDFYTQYDPQTQLIWAFPTPYVDYVKIYKPNELLPKTIDAVSREYPKIDRAKLDTIISNQADNLTIFYKSKRNSAKKFYNSLSKLEINGLKDKWRFPKQEEIYKNNPFKEYQQYFQLIWNKGNLVKINVPVLYLSSTQQKASLGYKKNKNLYNGSLSEKIKTVKHPENISLILPVKKLDSKIDKIVYDQKDSLDQKFFQLYEELSSSEKAIKALLGDPKIKNVTYDKKSKRLKGVLYSTTNNFQQNFSLKVAPDKFADLKEALLEQRAVADVKFAYKNGSLVYKSLSLKTNKIEEKEAYLEAKRTQNINFYREFIRMYPNSAYSKKLKNLIETEYKSKYKSPVL